MKTHKLLLHSDAKTAGNKKVTSPYNAKVLANVETADSKTVMRALSDAHKAFSDKKTWLALHERVAILEGVAQVMEKDTDGWARSAAAEGGKPFNDSRVEVIRAIDSVKLAIETIRTETGSVIPMGGTTFSTNRAAFTTKEPIGVVVAFSAFNHPLNLIVHQVATAVAAGCPVIVKPASNTPISAFRFTEELHKAGLPKVYAQCVLTDSHATSEQLVSDSRVAFFTFIGSAQVGWDLKNKLAAGTRCALEHGGAAPAVVYSDADMKATLASVAKGGFYHAGQVCVSTQRVFVESSVTEKFARALAKEAKKLKIGDPTKATTEVGPIISRKEIDRIDQWVQEAKAEGGKILCGGKRHSSYGYQPTVILNPSAKSKVSQMEIFGPVVCVYSFGSDTAAFKAANSLPFAFQAAVYTQNMDQAMRAYKALDATAIMINDHSAFRIDGMPFAGAQQSGLGIGGIGYTIEDMQIDKIMVIKSDEL